MGFNSGFKGLTMFPVSQATLGRRLGDPINVYRGSGMEGLRNTTKTPFRIASIRSDIRKGASGI